MTGSVGMSLRGVGLGWRPQLQAAVARAAVAFVEVIAENVDPRRLPSDLERLRDRGVVIVPHGVGLSLGGAERPQSRRLDHLAALAERLGAPLVSEHIAFVRAGGMQAGHLLPVARTAEALEILCENVALAQKQLPVPLALEHIAALVEWPGNELDEVTFLRELIDRTGARLVLDVSNLYANAHNHGYDARAALARLPLTHIACVHVGGGVHRDGRYHDTHADPVVPAVLRLVEELFLHVEAPGVLLERDDDFPSDAELLGELDAIAGAAARGRSRRAAAAHRPRQERAPRAAGRAR